MNKWLCPFERWQCKVCLLVERVRWSSKENDLFFIFISHQLSAFLSLSYLHFLDFFPYSCPSLLFDQAVVITSSDLCHVKTASYVMSLFFSLRLPWRRRDRIIIRFVLFVCKVGWSEVSVLVRVDLVSVGNSCPTFRNNVVVPSWSV